MMLFVPLGAKHNMILQLSFFMLYLPLAFYLTEKSGVEGFAYAFLIANALRIIGLLIVGVLKLPKLGGV